MATAVSDVNVKRPTHPQWKAFIGGLRDGDEVYQCDLIHERAICISKVHVTKTGRVYLDGKSRRDRTDWSRQPITYLPGGGDRFLAPLSGWPKT